MHCWWKFSDWTLVLVCRCFYDYVVFPFFPSLSLFLTISYTLVNSQKVLLAVFNQHTVDCARMLINCECSCVSHFSVYAFIATVLHFVISRRISIWIVLLIDIPIMRIVRLFRHSRKPHVFARVLFTGTLPRIPLQISSGCYSIVLGCITS